MQQEPFAAVGAEEKKGARMEKWTELCGPTSS